MSEAKDFSGTPPASTAANDGVVVLFPGFSLKERVLPFTENEIQLIRQMLLEFSAIKAMCPIARNITKQD